MTDPTRLLVPMEVRALVVDQNQRTTTWASLTPNFTLMNMPVGIELGGLLAPQPFQTSADTPTGVHLHWALPDALTHGLQGAAAADATLNAGTVSALTVTNPGFGYTSAPEVTIVGGGGKGATARAILTGGMVTSFDITSPGSGYDAPPTVSLGTSDDIEYPHVPNRWMVLRTRADQGAIHVKGWVVVSDQISDNAHGRQVVGALDKGLAVNLQAGTITQPIRNALTALGLDISANAVVQVSVANERWYVRDGSNFVSIEVETGTDQLLALTGAPVSWPTIESLDELYTQDVLARFLGRAMPYSVWEPGTPDMTEARLTALGPGDPAFAATYPNARSAFGFHDMMLGLDLGAQVSYLITGWYEDPSQDPLAGIKTLQALEARLSTLDWCLSQNPGGYPEEVICGDGSSSVTQDPAPVVPDTIVCHGLVTSVDWKGPNATTDTGIPQDTPDISIGNTGLEALSALIADKMSMKNAAQTYGAEVILEAFQCDLLDRLQEPDGLIELERALHQRTFGSTPGGVVWQIRREHTSTPHEFTSDISDSDTFPENIGKALIDLNAAQRNTDTALDTVRDLQWELYSAWYRKVLLEFSPMQRGVFAERLGRATRGMEPPSVEALMEGVERPERAQALTDEGSTISVAQIVEVIHTLEARLDTAQATAKNAQGKVESIASTLRTELPTGLPGFQLVDSPAPSYVTPNEPVMLFSGPGVERGYRHGEDDRFAPGDSLPCRLSGQTITALAVSVPLTTPKDVSLGDTDLSAIGGKMPSGGPVPLEIAALLLESMLLDTSLASTFATVAYHKAGDASPSPAQVQALAKTIVTLQRAPWNAAVHHSMKSRVEGLNAAALALASGFSGQPPYATSVALWEQPWEPLYLEWDIDWTASYDVASDLSIADSSEDIGSTAWAFDEQDFLWNTKIDPASPTLPSYRYSGRTIMAPSAQKNLAERIKAYLTEHPKSPYADKLQQIHDQVANLDILSQNLSGMNQTLVMRRESLGLPVRDLSDPTLGQKVATAVGSQTQLPPLPSLGYTPLRAGHMKVVRLWIVDAFGRAQRVIDQGQQYNPVLSSQLKTANHPTLAQLTPRLMQPARLDFDWLMASDDTIPTNTDPATSPLCGWLVPNYFDRSLLVYDASGTALGVLEVLAGNLGPDGSGIRWSNAPGTTSPLGAPPDFDNEHLESFVQGLLSRGTEEVNALSNLLTTLYQTLSNIVAQGSEGGYGSLSVLIGRPIAVLRASTRLALRGMPTPSQSWEALEHFHQTGEFITQGLETVSFPMRLGDVRCVRDGALGYFEADNYNTFHSTYIADSETQTETDYVTFNSRVRLAPGDAKGRLLTVLADPRLPIHVTSDLVPTQEVSVPAYGVQDALDNIDVMFRLGPLLQEADALSMPLPTDIHGSWSWIGRPDTGAWATSKTLLKDDDVARFPQTPRHVLEGWLALSGGIEQDG